MPDNFFDLHAHLNEQDNACTAHPIFAVQQRVRDYGYGPDYTDEYVYLHDGEYEEVDDDTAALLDEEYRANGRVTDGFVRVGYRDRWEFVTACLTEKGCEDYIRANGHNLTDPRIFVYSGHRNAEWQFLRSYFGKERVPTTVLQPGM